ncbi:hypothetical protein KGF56_000624 [Candida oxycetoniae]|uniref:ER membrane protein complex subunit 4 n=1 Tax=Candida oxycetoniae TaxID=497107 RepID=A0AAI9T0Q7_9ASCO|nr:uncharacterized protein KGF56_000624 [Candida oxycetoniae]KAI3406492.2 hypothetical protein KGF56_000624 [Candida oxycetoniae]
MTNSKFQEILHPQVVTYNKKGESISLPAGYSSPSVSIISSASTVSSASSKTLGVSKNATKTDLDTLKSKKVWESATAPAKSIPMNLFMSYMTGNSLQIIPMTMTMMLLWNPIKAIFNDTNIMFSKLKTRTNQTEITIAKVVFVLCQLLNMGVGVYKLYKMGLLPHSEADWLSLKEHKGGNYHLYV